MKVLRVLPLVLVLGAVPAGAAGEREVGVPSFPYDPEAVGEGRRACLETCLSERPACGPARERRSCESDFVLCMQSCSAPGAERAHPPNP